MIVSCLVGGYLSRLCGGGLVFGLFKKYTKLRRFKLDAGFCRFLYALPYLFMFMGAWYSIPGYLAAVAGKGLGHGQYIGLGYSKRQPLTQDEKIDPFLTIFFGRDWGGMYWRCVAGLAVTGIAVTALSGILWGYLINPLDGALIGLSGALKAPAYMIGWFLYRFTPISISPTVIGEFLTGVFQWGAILCLAF